MTTGELLDVFEADPDSAWTGLARAAAKACPTSRGGCDREDLIQESCLRALQENAAALRRAPRDTPLRPWIRNVVKRILLEDSRRKPAPLPREGGDGKCGDQSPPGVTLGDLDFRQLTDRQAQALALLAAGRSIAETARKLQIRWQSTRDLLGRAIQAGKRGKRQPRRGADRTWVDRVPASGKLTSRNRALLEMYARGATRREIADALDISREAVRCRLRRLRRGSQQPLIRPDHPLGNDRPVEVSDGEFA